MRNKQYLREVKAFFIGAPRSKQLHTDLLAFLTTGVCSEPVSQRAKCLHFIFIFHDAGAAGSLCKLRSLL